MPQKSKKRENPETLDKMGVLSAVMFRNSSFHIAMLLFSLSVCERIFKKVDLMRDKWPSVRERLTS